LQKNKLKNKLSQSKQLQNKLLSLLYESTDDEQYENLHQMIVYLMMNE